MVSGFLTSPCDHSRIFSGDAKEIRIALNESGSLGFSKKLKISRICFFLSLLFPAVICPTPVDRRRFDELDVQAECLELLDQNVEALRQPRLERVFALHDRLVHARSAHDVVALDGEELLERVRSAVRFHRPDLHLSETLAAEQGSSTQWL